MLEKLLPTNHIQNVRVHFKKKLKMKNIRLIFITILTLSFGISFGQSINYELTKSASEKIFIVDKDDVICLAKNSEKEKTLVYTF